MKKFNLLLLMSLIFGALVFNSCNEEEEVIPEAPTVTAPSSNITVAAGESVDVSFTVNVPGGYASAEVSAQGGSATISDEPAEGATSGTVVVSFTAGSTAGEASLTLTVTDQNQKSGNATATYTYTNIENFGVNLSGAEFSSVYPGIYGTNYIHPGRMDLLYFKNKGLELIRFPFRWERIQYEMNGPLIENEITRMHMFMRAADEFKLKVLLDMHNYGRYCVYSDGVNSANNQFAIIGDPRCTIENFCDVWKKLAQEFKDYDCLWGYDLMNEPHAMLESTPWKNIVQEVIYAIREVDTETSIIVSGDQFSSPMIWKRYSDNLKELQDPSDNLIFQAHVYFDSDATGLYLKSYDADGVKINTGVERLKPFVEWLKENNKRGFVGEYGVPGDDERWLPVLDTTLKYLQDNGVNGTYWSAGPWWGNYKLSLQPTNDYTVDRPQMETLLKYKTVIINK